MLPVPIRNHSANLHFDDFGSYFPPIYHSHMDIASSNHQLASIEANRITAEVLSEEV